MNATTLVAFAVGFYAGWCVLTMLLLALMSRESA
jgi:hypothetical protein